MTRTLSSGYKRHNINTQALLLLNWQIKTNPSTNLYCMYDHYYRSPQATASQIQRVIASSAGSIACGEQ